MPESKMEMKVEETLMDASEEEEGQSKQHLDWNVDMEVQLFYAMRGHKPVGVNRHFQMVCIHEKFKNSVQMDVTSQQIWDHLDTMYDMAALHESEIVPFPNEVTDFSLPDTDFDKQIEEKLQHAGSTDKMSRDDVVAATAGRATKDKEQALASDDKGDADKVTPKVTSNVGHKSTKESSYKKSTSLKESRASVSTTTPTTPTNTTASDAGDGSSHTDSGSHLKRKRNTRLQQEQQSASKPSSPASGSSSSKAKNKKTR